MRQAPRDRLGDPAPHRLPRRGQGRRPPPPRALGRRRLPRRPGRRGDPGPGARVRGRRHARRAHDRPALPRRGVAGPTRAGRSGRGRRAVRSRRSSPPTRRCPTRRSRASGTGSRDHTILIVDDDPLIRKLITTTLQDVAGYTLREAGDGLRGDRGRGRGAPGDRVPGLRHAAAERDRDVPAAALGPGHGRRDDHHAHRDVRRAGAGPRDRRRRRPVPHQAVLAAAAAAAGRRARAPRGS